MMVIDSHQHFWRYDRKRFAWITEEMCVLKRDFLPGHLATELILAGVDGTVAVQTDQSEEETHFLLELADTSRFVLGVVGWINLCAPDVSRRLAFFSHYPKLCGFRHIVQSEKDDWYLLREDFMNGIGALQSFNFTYDILIYPRQLEATLELVGRFPGQKFVIDHLAKPEIKGGKFEPWEAKMRLVAKNANVFCKLSGLITEADWHRWSLTDFRPYLDVALDAFGADRLMFGSDWPVCLLAGKYASVKRLIEDYLAQHSAETRCKIFGETAINFYGLGKKAHATRT